MANLNTTDVRVFPTSKRVGADPAAKYTTEYNLTNLVNRLTNREAFVITNNVIVDSNKISDFQFNILGYYFTVNLDFTPSTELAPLPSDPDNRYLNATIQVQRQNYGDLENANSKFKNFWNLLGDDQIPTGQSQKKFRGLKLEWGPLTTHKKIIEIEDPNTRIKTKINTDQPELSGVYKVDGENFTSFYTFTVLEYDGTNYYIPPASKIRLFTSTDGSYRGVSIDDGVLE